MFYDDSHQLHARVSEDAWYLRFYLWVWGAERSRVDFCKLFWGVLVFGWFGLLIKPFVVVGERLGDYFRAKERARIDKAEAEWDPAAYAKERDAQRKRDEERRQRRAERFERWFGWAPVLADRVVSFFQRAWPVLRWPLFALGGLLGLAALGAVGYLLYLLAVTAPEYYLIVPLGILLGGGIVLGIVKLAGTDPVQAAGIHTKEVGLTFGQAISKGVHGIKNRTCPKIEIIKSETT